MIYKNDCGLYRDGGLMIKEYINDQQIDQLRKKIIKISKEIAQLVFTCPKLTIEILEQGVKYVQS